MIKVYLDEGVVKAPVDTLLFELSRWGAEIISAKEIVHSSWEVNTKLLIIPGGRDVLYHGRLQGAGNRKIRSFVETGGSFLGLCAGAYYGCKFVEFDKGMPLEVLGERELIFFPGIARGPAYGPGTFQYGSEKGARMSVLSDRFSGSPFKAYFNGGCYFVDPHNYPNVNILSRYLDLPKEPAAIVECPLGKGKAILCGAHIEIGTTDPQTTLRGAMKQRLTAHETRRRQFFEKVLALLIHDH